MHSQKAPTVTVSIPPHLRIKMGSGRVPAASRQQIDNGSVHFQSTNCADTNSSSIFTAPVFASEAGHSAVKNSLVTDGIVDDLVTERLHKMALEPEPTPPPSPKTIGAQQKADTEHPHLTGNEVARTFKPLFIANLPQLPSETLSRIPSTSVDFAPEFIRNQLGGDLWSPGFNFIAPPQTSIVPNRAYYTVDPTHDPYLPEAPGRHGAKLVPFFNINPEDHTEFHLPDDYDSSSEVPLFVLRSVPDGSGKLRKRYVYYGHYAQSRWSDRLDYDRMRQCVPDSVREHWAEELSASGRPEWVTEALQKHFYPSPDYAGTLPGHLENEGGSVTEEEFAYRDQKVTKDISRYVEKLRTWKKEVNMRTSMIRKDFILGAFEKVSFATLDPRSLGKSLPYQVPCYPILENVSPDFVEIFIKICGLYLHT